jgi:hypothetical protein
MTALLAILNQVPGSASGGTLNVTATPSVAGAYVPGAGTWTTNSITASASGGTGPYTYAWTFVSGAASIAATAAMSATTAWTLTTTGPIAQKTATWGVTATDSASHTATAYVTVNFTGNL